ncbi:MAG: DUF2071 domain-containing protein [Candidatus Eremiobacteraeota bacterium]|nr:DUF2071 domain-containing protein [Candidatus Eremiobacteraeota bacterium]MBV8721045.1 DUF2071 domain-containing protein [Candidatus Eremiobacteraeota bacterium]
MREPRVFLSAEWRYLAMLNYAVDPRLLSDRIPPGTEIDFFGDKTYVTVVGFRFVHTRVLGVPIPLHQDFDEINLRFYVRRRAAEGWRRGVVFVRELVPKPAVAFVARAAFSEPYAAVSMSHDARDEGAGSARRVSVVYGWRDRNGSGEIALRAHGEPSLPVEGSIEQFIAEHYWGYGRNRSGRGLEYAVRHDPWRLWTADDAAFSGNAVAAYGPELARAIAGTPDSAFLAEGSPITVSWASVVVDGGRAAATAIY